MLRYPSGGRWGSYRESSCDGEGNALRLRVYGSKSAIYFDQEQPTFFGITPPTAVRFG